MGVEVKLFANFRETTGKSQISASAKDINHLLSQLTKKYTKLEDELFENPVSRKLKDHVIIFANGRNINFLDGLDTPLEDGDTVAIFPPVAGG